MNRKLHQLVEFARREALELTDLYRCPTITRHWLTEPSPEIVDEALNQNKVVVEQLLKQADAASNHLLHELGEGEFKEQEEARSHKNHVYMQYWAASAIDWTIRAARREERNEIYAALKQADNATREAWRIHPNQEAERGMAHE